MTGQEVQKRDHEQGGKQLDGAQIKFIATTDFVPKSYRGNIAAIMACIQTGRELGLGDLEALRSINVIDGRPSLSAELMVKLVRSRGHSITGGFAPDEVTIEGKRADNGDSMKVTWTLAMAQRAGLLNKDNWKKYPEAMLWARAVSQLCRMLFSDCLRGLSYTADEVEMTEEDSITEAMGTAVPVEDGPSNVRNEDVTDAEIVEDPPQAALSFEEKAQRAQAAAAAKEQA